MASPTQWTWVWVNSGSWWGDGQGGLACYNPWGVWPQWDKEPGCRQLAWTPRGWLVMKGSLKFCSNYTEKVLDNLSRGIVWSDSCFRKITLSSVQFSHLVVSNSLWPHEPQHTRPVCPSPTPRVYPNSCPLSWWCHPSISSSVIPFSSCPQSFPASGSFQMSQLFVSGGQSIGVSALAPVLPMNTQDWSPLGWTGWISLQSKGLSRVFSNTTVQKHQFFCTQLSL